MRDRLFMYIDSGFPQQVSWLRSSDEGDRRQSMSRGSLNEVGREASGCQLIVLVPGTDVLLTTAAVPSRQRQHIVSAVPYILEDQLADDVDEMHFALGPRDSDGQVPVAVVSRQRMHQWLEHLREAGLEPDIMVPDVMALPLQPDGWTVLHDGNTVIVRQGPYTGAVIDTPAASAWFELALGEYGDQRPGRITLYDCQFDSDTRLLLETGDIAVEAQAQVEPPLQFLARHFPDTSVINLIQGDYSRREQLGRLFRPWRVALALLIAVVVLQMAVSLSSYLGLRSDSQHLQAEIERVYRDTFPDAKKVVDARAQMQAKLAELGAAGVDGGQGFLPLMAQVGKSLQKLDGIELRHAAYQDGRLSLSLKIKSLQLLEQLKQLLLADNGLSVDIQSAASRDDYVDAHLQLSRQGS